MSRKFFYGALLLIVFGGLLFSCRESTAQSIAVPLNKNNISKEVKLLVPQKEELAPVIKEGVTLSAEESGAVTSDLSATIQEWLVEEHQYVKKGQPIARLDGTDYELMLEQNKGQLAALEAQYLSVEQDVARLKSLLDTQAIPQQKYDGAEAQRLALQRQIEAARKGIELVSRKVEKATVRAPFNGVITRKLVPNGYHVIIAMPNSGDIAQIEKTDRLKAVINLSEPLFREVEKGMPVEFFIPSLNRTVSAKVHSKNDSINALKKFAVVCYIDNAKHSLPAGVFAYASITPKSRTRTIVPSMSIKRLEQNAGEVYSVNSQGIVTAHKVYVGSPYETGTEIVGSIPEAIIADAGSVVSGEQVQTATIQ